MRARVQDRVGATDRVLHLRILAEQTGPAARRLVAGELDQRVDAGPSDAGDHGAVVGPDPGLGRQGVGDPGPAAPLIVQRDAGVDHRPALRQEDVLDRPVEAAGPAQPGHVPAPVDDVRFRTREDPAPVRRRAVRAAARLVAVENLEAPEHPRAFLTAAAEAPATGDAKAAIDRHRLPAALHGRAGDDGVGPVPRRSRGRPPPASQASRAGRCCCWPRSSRRSRRSRPTARRRAGRSAGRPAGHPARAESPCCRSRRRETARPAPWAGAARARSRRDSGG